MTRPTLERLALLGCALLLLAMIDLVVLEAILKPVIARRGIPWSDFEVPLPFGWGRCLAWHLGFVPLGLGVFALLGWASRDARLAASGAVLFATGWEDALYYLLQLAPLPAELPWLDPQPFVSWTRLVLRDPHVSRGGLLLAMTAGGAVAAALLSRRRAPFDGTAPPP